MKMYTGAETRKETQHISPHIATHKSSLAPTSSVSTLSSVGLTDSGTPHDLAQPHLGNKSGINTHIPTYKTVMHPPHHSVSKNLDHNGPVYLSRHGHSGQSAQHSKSIPQDLSSHADKTLPIELTPNVSSHHKPLPHIQTISGNHIGASLLPPAHQNDRGPYFRMPDISVQGPSAVLVSSGGDVGASSNLHVSHPGAMVYAQSSMPAHSSTGNLTTMPPASLAATVAVPGGLNPSISMSHNHVMASESITNPQVGAGCGMQQLDLRGVKKEKVDQMDVMGQQDRSQQIEPQKDLVRQALQAVVTNPQHKTGNDQEVIEYNYTAGDIAELLMMNIQVNASLQAMNKTNVPTETGSGQVVLLQPAAVDDPSGFGQPLTPKRRRPRPPEDFTYERRVKIAMRMREKRAIESDEQRIIRRQKEAERMRRKRATEDEETKKRRRLDAAARARNRRASMTVEEREIDRQRAAERMRTRRATESPETKSIRRLKAAERMRKRRATETPEQRSKRRQLIALRMKARRKKLDDINGDDDEEEEDTEIITRSITTRYGKSSSSLPESSEEGITENPGNASSTTTSTSSSVSFVPSTSIGGGSVSIMQVPVDTSIPQMITHQSGVSSVNMNQLPQPLSLQKSSSSHKQEMPEPLSLQKQEVPSQQPSPVATPEPSVALSSLTATAHGLGPLPLHKTSYHHHLPHLLHYHQHPSQQPLQHAPHHHQHHHHSHHHLQHRHHHQ